MNNILTKLAWVAAFPFVIAALILCLGYHYLAGHDVNAMLKPLSRR